MAAKLTQEQKAKAYKLLNVEYNDDQIAKSLGVSKILVERWRHAIGLPEGSGERVVTAGRKKAPAEEAPVIIRKLSDEELAELKARLSFPDDKNTDPEDYDAPADDIVREIQDIREEATGFFVKDEEAFVNEVKKKRGRPSMKKILTPVENKEEKNDVIDISEPKEIKFAPATIGQLRGILQEENDASLLVIGGRLIELKEVNVRRQLATGKVFVELMGDSLPTDEYEGGADE